MFTPLRSTALAVLTLFACGGAALAGDFGHRGGYGRRGFCPDCEPACKVAYQTCYRDVKVVKYKQECVTDYVEQECTVPRQIVETHYKEVPEVVYTTITDYRIEQVDRGCYERQACYDAHGCVIYKKVWVPRLCTVKVPYERVVKECVTKEVPYQVARTVYDKVIKKVPVEKVVEVPYVVTQRVAYRAPVQVACTCPPARAAY